MYKVFGLCFVVVGCAEKAEEDPCADIELPTCELEECPEDYQSSHGDECSADDEDCTTGTGTGRICSEGTWVVLEPSHGSPTECNIECVFSEE